MDDAFFDVPRPVQTRHNDPVRTASPPRVRINENLSRQNDDGFEDVEDFDSFFDVPRPARARRAAVPVRATSPPVQSHIHAGTSTGASVTAIFGFKAKSSEEPRPFTPGSDSGEPAGPDSGSRDRAMEIDDKLARRPALHQPSAVPKPVDRATALLQQLEAKAEQHKAGAWGGPSRSTAPEHAARAPAPGAMLGSQREAVAGAQFTCFISTKVQIPTLY